MLNHRLTINDHVGICVASLSITQHIASTLTDCSGRQLVLSLFSHRKSFPFPQTHHGHWAHYTRTPASPRWFRHGPALGRCLLHDTPDNVDAVIAKGLLPDGRPLRSSYTGIGLLDHRIEYMVAFYRVQSNSTTLGPCLLFVNIDSGYS
ncbi:hypothetical protein F5B21DRAFT_493387 [Xylaria acuta]|nr:hypothetical protein F5B21DRAFT_493387 [Xylaria acuta]